MLLRAWLPPPNLPRKRGRGAGASLAVSVASTLPFASLVNAAPESRTIDGACGGVVSRVTVKVSCAELPATS